MKIFQETLIFNSIFAEAEHVYRNVSRKVLQTNEAFLTFPQ